jgi:hypothetical protein
MPDKSLAKTAFPTDVNELHISFHAACRLHQRGIGLDDLQIALDCGARRWSHGDLIFLLTDRALQNTPHEHKCARLRGLCLVITCENVVRTVKWDKHAARHPGVLRRARLKASEFTKADARRLCLEFAA